ncbi:Membrane-anchored lipid-binding protein YSP2 [Candida viswanathii]|uniref:Membrane-anchored lipid-binding protein YSP2 n=1 Tax=Candida viswanathii TaxID=5486 RepID=A0A367XPV3_9ASCO|nr:Membrane-anchored lipid-binding protein YSP2 [Candida viswanathii]
MALKLHKKKKTHDDTASTVSSNSHTNSSHRKSLNLFQHHKRMSSGTSSEDKSFRGMINSLNRSHSQSRSHKLNSNNNTNNPIASGSQTPRTLPSSPTISRSNSLPRTSGNALHLPHQEVDMPGASLIISNEELERVVQQPEGTGGVDINLSPNNGSELLLNVPDKQATNVSHTSSNTSQHPPTNQPPSKTPTQDSQADQQPAKQETGGFLSMFINSAPNKSATPPDGGGAGAGADDSKDKKKEHTSFAARLDNLLKGVKHEDSKASLSGEAPDEQNDREVARTSTDLKSVHSLTQDVQFQPVRESPLKTLGNGDLSLDDFDPNVPGGLPEAGGFAGSRRPSFRSADSATKRALSPNTVDNAVSEGNQAQFNGLDAKRAKRRSGMSNGERQSSVGRSSIVDNQTMMSSEDHRSSIGAVRSRTSDLPEDLDLLSDSELENLDNIVDYSKKIKHALKKRDKEFHQIFKKLPKDERLIDEFSCAFSKDILVQGKMYLSDHYICFNSNILGWVTNLIIPLQEVIQIEKKSTAVLFPNGMVIRTLHQKYVFATFLSRDTTFDIITNVWHRVMLENSDIDPKKLQATLERKRRRANSNVSQFSSIGDESDDDLEGSEDDDDGSMADDESGHEASLDDNEDDNSDDKGTDDSDVNGASVAATSGSGKDGNTFKGLPVVGPLTHAPTSTGYTKDSNETFIVEDTIKAPPGVVFLILFGPDTSKYIRILKEQKNFDITESSIKGLSKDNKERSYTYIKPLGGAIGPKQTKCVIEDKVIEYLPDKYYEVEQTTQTPDVPSGNSFKVITKIFLSWAANNETKIYIVTSIEWSGKSWIKGAIEKGTIDGQKESMGSLISIVNKIIATSGDKKPSKKGSKGGRSRKGTIKRDVEEEPAKEAQAELAKPKSIGEQFTELINSIGDLVPVPFLSNTIVGAFVLLVGFLLSFSLVSKLTHRNSLKTIEIIPSNLYTSKIQINGEKYLVLPTIDANFNNDRMKKQEELSIWNWINERSNGKLNLSLNCDNFEKLSNEELKTKYTEQELKEIVRLTKLKLDKLSEKLNDINL